MIRVYVHPTCSSCRKAQALLTENDVEFDRLDYFKERFTAGELRGLLDEIGMTPTEVVSTRSKAYKTLGLVDRNLSDDELLELMVENPTLLRRPIIVSDGEAVVGFNQQEIEDLIGKQGQEN